MDEVTKDSNSPTLFKSISLDVTWLMKEGEIEKKYFEEEYGVTACVNTLTFGDKWSDKYIRGLMYGINLLKVYAKREYRLLEDYQEEILPLYVNFLKELAFDLKKNLPMPMPMPMKTMTISPTSKS